MDSFPLAKKKKFTLITGLALVIIALAMVIGVSTPFFNSKYVNASSNQIVLKDVDGSLYGGFKITSANNTNKCFDVEGGTKMENSVKIIAYDSHTISNQKFNFTPLEYSNGYIYSITVSYSDGYALDISNGSAEDNASLQLYQYNGTAAQKFMIKAVYQGDVLKGYVLLTGSSSYKKVLALSGNYIVQKTFNYNLIDLNQIWFFEQCFYGFTYSKSGYLDSNKNSGGYNAINYDNGNQYNGGYYLDMNYWEQFEQFITIDTSSSFKSQDARISANGYTFLDSVSLNLKIDNSLKIKYADYLILNDQYVQIGSDGSNYVNGNYINGTVGKGTMEIEYIDDNGKKYSEYKNNIFSSVNTSKTFYSNEFNKVGRYAIRFYYKVSAEFSTYVMKEINFSVISSSGNATAISSITDGEKTEVISSYRFTLDNKSNISVIYDGNQKFRAKDDDIINYVAGVIPSNTESEIKTKLDSLKEKIKAYTEYKVFFTNRAFHMNAYGNKFTELIESIQGYNSVVANVYRGSSPINNTDGIYEYETKNLFKTDKNYYKVYVQSQPNQQVFRNVTYCYKNENEEIINYAIDYAFLEDLKIFPYTMTVSINYINLEDENSDPVNYVSNSIIYNTSSNILKLKFTVLDLSGNETSLFLYIYPPKIPSLNLENLTILSNDYNYITTGYKVLLYDGTSKTYNKYLFSTYNIAFENLVTNIISNQDICKINDDGSYSVNWQSTTNKFSSNVEFMEWITDYAQNVIKYTSISPYVYSDYTIPEKNMRFDTLYLSKDFSFTTDTYFPLFESYKVYFKYFSEDGIKLKDGIITYDGDYKYGETMFKILSANNPNNWVNGYVEFTEYNISANSGATYTARIVKSNSKLELKIKNGTKYENNIYSSGAEITCEQFEFKGDITEDTTIIMSYNNATTYYNYFTYDNIKFNEIGVYEIEVINTHKKSYTITINVQGLASSFIGVSNFGETTENVKFTTQDLNFKCYINGVLQKDLDYTIDENQLYTFVFEKQETDLNVHVIKDEKTFSFVIKGDKELDLSNYEITELAKFTVVEIRNYLNVEIEKLNALIYDVNSLLNEYNEFENTIKSINYPNSSGKYDTLINTLLLTKNKKQELENRYKEILENSVIIKVAEVVKINLLKENFDLVLSASEQQYKSFKNFTINYFEDNHNIVINNNIYNEIKDKQEQEIKNLYSNYLNEVNNYSKLSSKIVVMETKIYSYDNLVSSYKKSLENIAGNQISNLEQAVSILTEYEKEEQKYYSDIASFKSELISYSVLNSNNIFVKEYLINEALNKINQVNLLIDEYAKNQNFEVYERVKEMAVNLVDEYKQEIENLTSETTQKFNEYTEALETLNNEKKWWKIFSNISRNNKIDKYTEKLSYLIADFEDKKILLDLNIADIESLINQIKQSKNIIIEEYVLETISNFETSLNNVAKKIAG